MTQEELVVKLEGLTAVVQKVKTEVIALKEAVEQGPAVSPEVQAAVDALEAAIDGVDDVNEDAPVAE